MIDVWQDPTYDPNDNDLFSWIGQLKKPSKHSPIQNQKLKHQKKVQNMFKVNNKDTRTTSMTSLLLALDIFHIFFYVLRGWGGGGHHRYPNLIASSAYPISLFLPKKCRFCNFYTVFGYFGYSWNLHIYNSSAWFLILIL